MTGEPDRGVDGHGPQLLRAQNIADPGGGNSQRQRQCVGRETERLHEFLSEDLAGMGADARPSLSFTDNRRSRPFGAFKPQSQSAKARRARSASATRAGSARTRRTANLASDDQDRSARLSPSPKRRGNRSCGKPQAAAHRRCSLARLGERMRRLDAVGAPIRHHGSVPSGGGASVSDRASCQPGCPRNSSRPSSRRTGPAPRRRATRRRENRVQSNSPSA